MITHLAPYRWRPGKLLARAATYVVHPAGRAVGASYAVEISVYLLLARRELLDKSFCLLSEIAVDDNTGIATLLAQSASAGTLVADGFRKLL